MRIRRAHSLTFLKKISTVTDVEDIRSVIKLAGQLNFVFASTKVRLLWTVDLSPPSVARISRSLEVLELRPGLL